MVVDDAMRYLPVRSSRGQRGAGTVIAFMRYRAKDSMKQFLTGHETRHDNVSALHNSEAMTMLRHGNLSPTRQVVNENSVPRFSIQHRIQILQKELNDFNERIAELESAGHRGRAIEGLKAHAIDFARQIDELRCFLAQRTTKSEPRKLHP